MARMKHSVMAQFSTEAGDGLLRRQKAYTAEPEGHNLCSLLCDEVAESGPLRHRQAKLVPEK
jgi:hypothetical protein